MRNSISLLFEGMVSKQLSSFPQQELCVGQHGFRNNLSVFTQLLFNCNRLYKTLEANKMPITVYLDIAKTFNTINFKIVRLNYAKWEFIMLF